MDKAKYTVWNCPKSEWSTVFDSDPEKVRKALDAITDEKWAEIKLELEKSRQRARERFPNVCANPYLNRNVY